MISTQQPAPVCPKCGGELQATQVYERYFTMGRLGKFKPVTWQPKPEPIRVRFYCENDCELKPPQPELVDRMPEDDETASTA